MQSPYPDSEVGCSALPWYPVSEELQESACSLARRTPCRGALAPLHFGQTCSPEPTLPPLWHTMVLWGARGRAATAQPSPPPPPPPPPPPSPQPSSPVPSASTGTALASPPPAAPLPPSPCQTDLRRLKNAMKPPGFPPQLRDGTRGALLRSDESTKAPSSSHGVPLVRGESLAGIFLR